MPISRFLTCCALALSVLLHAQLIPTGRPVPIGAQPPVVFLNGYQTNCGSTDFGDSFAQFDSLLQATGRVSLFFDNCAFSGKPSIEELGGDFGAFLADLRYTDGTPVQQVDVVAHSMGGLIVRSYLAGKQVSGGFQPPASPPIRKAVFLATPHFGTPIASEFGIDTQTMEMGDGSQFTYDLATWNQGTGDLRGIDALAVIGNGGTGEATIPGFDDGVVPLTSGSIGFAVAGRTRVIPYCHTGPGLVTLAGLCPADAPGIAEGLSADDPNSALVLSFLNDTPDWETIGQAAGQNAFLSVTGGVTVRAKTAGDEFLTIQSATASAKLSVLNGAIAWSQYLPAQVQTLALLTPSGTVQQSFTLPSGYVSALTVKTGPLITRILPSAAVTQPLAIAPGMFASIYGSNLAVASERAAGQPYQTTLGGVQVSVGGTPAGLQFVSARQINAVIPDGVSGLVTVTLTNAAGSSSVNALVQPAVPAIFTMDESGSGPAAAENAVTGAVITSTAPIRAGEYVALYLTGLGAAHTAGANEVADQTPSVTVGGMPCNVNFAGRAPGYAGLDQINCQVPSGFTGPTSANVQVTSAGRTSNTATLAVAP